ncbi:MAG: 2-C-methyl-D-erythritol 2,4-cyclodiphosphate synthase [Kangiellaceae bacterium]|nr:2-C-methyl-D-erythritol 2,4-cyclodiphosphate synthase [Kangiellaceae bacterium]
MRIGHGYDVHAFGGDNSLILGGVNVDDHIGLLAHSDGDVVLHAVCDALLGALALGDIGTHFPDTDEGYKNISSRELLAHVYALVKEEDYQLSNLDITVIAQTPRLSSYIRAMQTCIADDLKSEPKQINIKATTTENLGYIGRKEGIAVHCVCLLNRI